MQSIVIYLLKVNIVITILTLLYLILLKKETTFQLNRVFLLTAIISSFLLPYTPSIKNPRADTMIRGFNYDVPEVYLSRLASQRSSISHPIYLKHTNAVTTGPDFIKNLTIPTIIDLLCFLYLVIASTLILKLFVSICTLLLALKSAKREVVDGINYCTMNKIMTPFSFFNNIVINKSYYSPSQLTEIIIHEKVHVAQGHSADVLFIEIVHCLLWVNPIVLFLKRIIKLNLEYIADDKVLQTGIEKQVYQRTILQTFLKSKLYPLANPLFSPKIKQRILMMNTKKNTSGKIYKYALVIPVFISMNFFLGSFTPKEGNYRKDKNNTVPIQQSGAIKDNDLKVLEGYYNAQENEKGKSLWIKVFVKENNLALMELWTGNIIILDRISDLTFNGKTRRYPVVFKKDKSGKILEALIFETDQWKRADTFQPPLKKVISLDQTQLKKLEGIYQSELNTDAYIEVSTIGNKIVTRPMWEETEYEYAPLSPLEFTNLDNDCDVKIKFVDDRNKDITTLVRPDNSQWRKVSSYAPQKETSLTKEQLSNIEGLYTFKYKCEQGDKIDTLQIVSKDGELQFYELWVKNGKGGKLIPVSETRVVTRENPFSIEFKKDRKGKIVQCVALFPFVQDHFTKIR